MQGEQVFFSIKTEPKGPAAASVRVLSRLQLGGPAYGYPTPVTWHRGSGMAGAATVAHRDQTFFGILKSFSEEKGWGHITCDATGRLYGKDIFLMRGALNGQTVQPGTLISFKVHMGSKGPQAASVMLLPQGSFRVEGEEATVFTGVIKSFNAEKGWGFVASEDLQQTFGKDIFIHKRELDGHTPNTGEEVQFSVEIDEGGQPVAKNATASMRAGYGAAPSPQPGPVARAAPY